ncbi:MAG: cell division protein FtsZ [Methanomassiliicoccales archaeon]|nr:cell division protein FtsZ [Methanomassiliicoccales archaeon]
MKSILDRVLETGEGRVTEISDKRTSSGQTTADDEELRRIVETLRVKIAIIGCGGGGSNTIRRLYQAGIVGATLVAANSDAKHLLSIVAPNKVLLGRTLTRGLGAGAIPDVGKRAAEEAREELAKYLDGQHIVFVTAGLGGGTGTGAAPIVAELARQRASLVMGVVTLPFKAEGKIRMENALRGLSQLREFCDTTIVIPNDRLLEIVPKLPLEAAFKVADEVLVQSIKGLTEIITKPGLVNVDFNDVMTIMKNGGVAMIGIGESDEDEGRVDYAVKEALSSPLLGELDLHEARGALVRIVGGPDMTVSEAEKAAEIVSKTISPMARIIWGCSVEPECEGKVRVMVVLTGVKSNQFLGREFQPNEEIDRIR